MHFHLNLISGVSLYARCQLCGIEKCKCVLSGRIAGTSKASLPLPRFERVCNAETTPVDDDDYGARGRDPFGIVISANVYIAYLRLIIMLVSRKKILFTSISDKARKEYSRRIRQSAARCRWTKEEKARSRAYTSRACILCVRIMRRAMTGDSRVIGQ